MAQNVIVKYLNFKTPKNLNLAENNETLSAKLYNFDKNLSFRKILKNNVQKWKKEHQLYIIKGLLKKKAKPMIIHDEESQKVAEDGIGGQC